MAKSFSEVLAVNEATELKRDDIFFITQDGSSAGIRSNVIESTINATIIRSQDDFNNIIERITTFTYKIKDGIYALVFKPLAGGYKMYGGTSPLSGGDSFGFIKTNQCLDIYFTPNTYIDMGDTRGYIEVNTGACVLKNVSIRGIGTTPVAIDQSYKLNANNVIYINCDTQTRYTSNNFAGFRGSASVNETSKYIGCSVYNINSIGASNAGFASCYNLTDCYVDTLSVLGFVGYGFNECSNISNCIIKTLSGTEMRGISLSNNISNCIIKDIACNITYGIDSCYNISNCTINNLNSSISICRGINNCDNVSNCQITQLDAVGNCDGMNLCNFISSCFIEDIDSSGGDAYGFNECDFISASIADNVDASGTAYGYNVCNYVNGCTATACNTGFITCLYVSGCNSDSNSLAGFSACDFIGQCRAYSNGTTGFLSCDYISNCNSDTNNTGFSNCDAVVGSRAVNNTVDGFLNCNHIEHNRSGGNGGANYNNSFADWAATRAAAATDAGGDNA